jgi:transposase
VIDLTQKQTVILKHLNNVSNREIARQMHMSKDTVNKYVKEYDEKRNELLFMNPELEQSEIIQAFVEKPKYDSHNRGPLKKTEDATYRSIRNAPLSRNTAKWLVCRLSYGYNRNSGQAYKIRKEQ